MALLNEIQETMKYASNFGGKLSLGQLCHRLLSDKTYSKSEIEEIINNYKLGITNKINQENNYKIKLAKILVEQHLSKFKNILFVAITGSVAAENSKKDEDVDLFLICKKDTMWLTRLLLRIYIKLHNIPHRKFGQDESPNDFCFNLWMDESNLLVPLSKQNQKNAVDIIMMKVIYDKNNIYQKFIDKNDWVKKYVANGYSQIIKSKLKHQNLKNKTSILILVLNYIAYIGQLLYIRLKGPVKYTNLTQAFFHK